MCVGVFFLFFLPWQVKHWTWKCVFLTRTTSPRQTCPQRSHTMGELPPLEGGEALLLFPPYRLDWYWTEADKRRSKEGTWWRISSLTLMSTNEHFRSDKNGVQQTHRWMFTLKRGMQVFRNLRSEFLGSWAQPKEINTIKAAQADRQTDICLLLW